MDIRIELLHDAVNVMGRGDSLEARKRREWEWVQWAGAAWVGVEKRVEEGVLMMLVMVFGI